MRRAFLNRVGAFVVLTLAVSLQLAPADARRRDFGAVVAPVRLIARGEDPIAVSGLPSYFGTVELGSASDGLLVSNRVSLERYLLGLNEVPTDWPFEALRAQAVAARTYALWTLAQPREGLAAVYGFDICATVQCQVFSGADVVRAENGARWAAAVEDTAGLAVLYDGRPILARYHSTSGGRTFDNPDGFPEEPAYPYLQSVTSTTETASPVYRWRVSFRLDRLTRILRRGGMWDGGRVRRASTRPSSTGGPYPEVVLVGSRSRTVMPADTFRDAVREEAPALYPDRYPSPWHTVSGRLPETLPSERFDIATRGRLVIVNGRGWGHGVGMSQWGAYGLAQQGASFTQILQHYYSGVAIGGVDTSAPIEVGVAFGRDSVTANGAFRIVDGNGKTIVGDALGTWSFRSAGQGAVAIDPPRGFGLPLKVGIVKAPKKVGVGDVAFVTIALSRPAKVRAETVGVGENHPEARIKGAGKRRITWLAPLEAGRYRVRVRVLSGGRKRVSEAVRIVVAEPPTPPEADLRGDSRGVTDEGLVLRWTLVGAGLALVLVVVVSVVLSRRSQPPE